MTPDELMRQAAPTIAEYLRSAIEHIDAQLGDGYAKAHPELLGAFIRAAALDFHAGILSEALSDAAYEIRQGLEMDDGNPVAIALDDVAAKLDTIATSIVVAA